MIGNYTVGSGDQEVLRLLRGLSRTSMRFHPKSRASSDHAPGPSSTRATHRVAKRTSAHGFPRWEMALHNPRAALSDPEMGVHKPMSRRIPQAIATTARVPGPIDGPSRNTLSPTALSPIPATRRINRRPAPGKPRANVEKRRRTNTLRRGYLVNECEQSPKRVGAQ